MDQRTVPASADAQATTLEETRNRIETSWQALLDAIEGVPDDLLAEPGAVGEWSVKDLFGHVAYWDERAVLAAEQVSRGEKPSHGDWEADNAREAAINAGRPLEELRTRFERSHEAVRQLLDGSASFEPAIGIGICGCLREDTWEHYDEHAADIRAWRSKRGL
ncbi:MAG: hypothetical protein AVDCRST_MAG73-286 [uncultured Thermomicrobiales bacterium]|uniref:DinB-like domain-containing protein n=1 Tax=uncultured Thermomicrobiales bacterium TaxID=1645740 RepID=A0A6J4TG91_9BACT|nr:MAG: hypothetical protein AVDCRST_MAG73-286 [uncultured Thermomicrobiales bacterium]